MAATALDTDLAANVKKALKRESATPMFFAFVMKGGTDGKLIVSKARVQPKQIDAAKKETGGSAVLKGVCFGESGTLVFETAKPAAANVAAATKNVLKVKASLTLMVEYRVGRDDETVPESTEPDLPGDAGKAAPGAEGAAAGTPAAADVGAEFKAKLAAWTPAIKAALAAKGPNAAAVGKLLAQATALSKPGGDTAQALEKLTECHALAAAGAAPAAQPKAAGGDAAAEFKAKLAAWTPAIKAALAAKGPNAAAVGKLLAQATALSKPGGDMAQALAHLTECHTLATAAVAPAAQPKVGGDAAAEFKAKLAAWTPAIKAALAAKGPDAAAIGKLLAQATALSKPGGDMAQALAKLTEGHALATSDRAPPKTGSTTPEIKKGIVETRKFLLTRWKLIPKEIAADLDALIKRIAVEHPNITNLDELRAVIDEQLQALYDELQDEIDEAINSGDSTVLKGLRERVLKHEFVNHLTSNPYVSGSKFQTSLLNALQEMEQRLAS